MNALLWLVLLSIRGRLLRWARLMRQPKYLVGTLAGLAYLVFVFARPMGEGGMRVLLFEDWVGKVETELDLIRSLAAFGLAVLLTGVWLFPWGRSGLAFKEAELQLLLSAPVSRVQLILYAILRSQRSVLISAMLLAVVLGSGGLADRLRYFAGAWLFVTFMDLNGKARSLFLLRQREVEPRTAFARRVLLALPFLAFWTVLGPGVARWIVSLQQQFSAETIDFNAVILTTRQTFAGGSLDWLLTPFGWPLGPLLAREWPEFAGSAVPALLLSGTLLWVVAHSRAHFEESSLEQARARDRRKTRRRRYAGTSRRGRLRSPFPLAAGGRPELAILWKNLMQVARWRVRTVFLLALLLLVWLAVLPAVTGAHEWVFGTLGLAGAMLAMMGPLLFGLASRNDLRTDLLHLDSLRCWPVSAARMMAAEIVSPAIHGTALWLLGAGVYLAASSGAALSQLIRGERIDTFLLPLLNVRILDLPPLPGLVMIIAGLLPLVAGLTLLMSALKNLAVLMFPAWIELGPTAARGMAALGQRLVTGGGLALALMLGLVPSFLIVTLAGVLHGMTGLLPRNWTMLLWAVLASAPLFVEAAVLISLAGRLWQRLDPSREILELSA